MAMYTIKTRQYLLAEIHGIEANSAGEARKVAYSAIREVRASMSGEVVTSRFWVEWTVSGRPTIELVKVGAEEAK